jgi:hypothetical protein
VQFGQVFGQPFGREVGGDAGTQALPGWNLIVDDGAENAPNFFFQAASVSGGALLETDFDLFFDVADSELGHAEGTRENQSDIMIAGRVALLMLVCIIQHIRPFLDPFASSSKLPGAAVRLMAGLLLMTMWSPMAFLWKKKPRKY